MKKIIVNLGCGKTRIPNSIGVDQVGIKGFTDIIHDLDIIPYPFTDNSVDEIHFYHIIEHLHEPLKKIEEIYRILKPGGILNMRAPHFSSMGAFTDLTHIRPFGLTSFDCFEKSAYHHFYTRTEFNILKKEIKYFGQYPNSGVYEKYIHKNECLCIIKPYIRLINLLIRMSPVFLRDFGAIWLAEHAK